MRTSIPSDEHRIMKAIRKNNCTGWELLFTKYDPLIKAVVRWPKWHFKDDEQQDVCQNIHMQLQSAIPAFKQQCSLSWFIKQIAIRQCINEIRRQKRWSSVLTSLTMQTTAGYWNEMEFVCPNTADPHEAAIQNEQLQSLRTALKKLHETCRQSIHMFYMQHLSYKQMADTLGITVNTVGSRLSKCLDKLKKELQKKPQFERIT